MYYWSSVSFDPVPDITTKAQTEFPRQNRQTHRSERNSIEGKEPK